VSAAGRPGSETRLATAMVVGSIVSVQCGAAAATTLFDEIGPWGAVLMRAAFGALALLALAWRGLRVPRGRRLREIVLFGAILAAVNLVFYEALDRLPLGIAVTLEFVGPLGVAVLGSRRRRDLVWVTLAALGIVLLSGGSGGESVDALGVAFALAAGVGWGLYIVQSARLGRAYPGHGALALAMVVASILVAPFGIAQGGGALLTPAHLAVGAAVGLLSAAIPYTLELEALRRLPQSVFGVLMSLEPAVAALVGFLALSQDLAPREVLAIALVVLASAGALRSAGAPAPRDG
jgi:inner membrane transporter RhtA